jgi:hypothetical protein
MTLSLLLALAGYALIVRFLIDPYVREGAEAGRVLGVYQAYDGIHRHFAATGAGKELLLFWGSSMIREGVDARLLEASAPWLVAYNLSVSGDIPYRRLVELPRAIALHPDRVVIGVSYPDLFEDRTPFEDQIGVLPAVAYESMPTEAKALLNRRFLQIAQRSEWERFWWKRKFFLSATLWRLGIPDRSNPLQPGYATEFKAPWVYHKSVTFPELQRFLKQRQNYYPPYSENQPIEPGNVPSGRSLALLVRYLQAQETKVILVNMPLHPLLNAIVPPERRRLLRGYLQSLVSSSVAFVDYQDKFPPEDFIDLVHLNEAGRRVFTGAMLGCITQSEIAAPEFGPPAANAAISRSRHAF